jgi:hypothetical protein
MNVREQKIADLMLKAIVVGKEQSLGLKPSEEVLVEVRIVLRDEARSHLRSLSIEKFFTLQFWQEANANLKYHKRSVRALKARFKNVGELLDEREMGNIPSCVENFSVGSWTETRKVLVYSRLIEPDN